MYSVEFTTEQWVWMSVKNGFKLHDPLLWAVALACHADWQAAQDLILSETVTVQIPDPTQQPSSHELTQS